MREARSFRMRPLARVMLLVFCSAGAACAADPHYRAPSRWYIEDPHLREFRAIVYHWPLSPLRLDLPHEGVKRVKLSLEWRLEAGPIVWPSLAEDLSDELLKSLEPMVGDFPEKRRIKHEGPDLDEQ